jgi:hypothetical protein
MRLVAIQQFACQLSFFLSLSLSRGKENLFQGLMLWKEDLEAAPLVFWEDLLWVVAEHRGLVSECSDLLQASEVCVFAGPKGKSLLGLMY